MNMQCNDNRNDDKKKPLSKIDTAELIKRRVEQDVPGFKVFWKKVGREQKGRVPMINMNDVNAYKVMNIIYDETLCLFIEQGVDLRMMIEPMFTFENNHYAG